MVNLDSRFDDDDDATTEQIQSYTPPASQEEKALVVSEKEKEKANEDVDEKVSAKDTHQTRWVKTVSS